jgi:hypothetical protein
VTPVAKVLQTSFERARLPVGRPARMLLMLSGGLDSVALLTNLLESTEHEVHAHHIVLDNFEDRAGAENAALERLRAWCDDHLRPFGFSSSVHGFRDFKGGGWDTTLTMFTASRVVRALASEWQTDLVITGHINPGFNELAEGEAVFHAAFMSRRRRPAWVRPLAWLSGDRTERKVAIRESVPDEVADCAWWCRRPVTEGEGWRPCGECHACKIMAEVDAHRAGGTQGPDGNGR